MIAYNEAWYMLLRGLLRLKELLLLWLRLIKFIVAKNMIRCVVGFSIPFVYARSLKLNASRFMSYGQWLYGDREVLKESPVHRLTCAGLSPEVEAQVSQTSLTLLRYL